MNPRCSIASADTSLTATAPHVKAWIAIEYPGAWGARAVETAPLPGLAELRAVTDPHGVRILLIRQERHHRDERTIIIATPTGMCGGVTHDVREALDWDWRHIADGVPPDFGSTMRNATLICTNGKRDQCCAIEGRALIERYGHDASVWECTHIGGHRYAPVVLDLPSGLVFGRMTPADLDELSAGRVPLDRLRGSSFQHPAAQAADAAYRAASGDTRCATVPITLTKIHDRAMHARVEPPASGPRDFTVTLRDVEPRLESCGAELVSAQQWLVIG